MPAFLLARPLLQVTFCLSFLVTFERLWNSLSSLFKYKFAHGLSAISISLY